MRLLIVDLLIKWTLLYTAGRASKQGSPYLAGLRIVVEAEAVAADARGAWFADIQGCGHGHCRVGRIAARTQNPEANLAGQRLAAGRAAM